MIVTAERYITGPCAARAPKNRALLIGSLSLIAGVILGSLFQAIHAAFPVRPETAVMAIAGLAAGMVVLAAGIYMAAQRQSIDPSRVAVVTLAGVGVVLVGLYFCWVGSYVFFPADILIWSEGDFLNDILKFRTGYPLYSQQANNNSFTYVPGSQLLTYMVAGLAGKGTSPPPLRVVQVIYTALASLIAVTCCLRLLDIAGFTRRLRVTPLWFAVWTPILFLAATNSITNRFAHALHGDALAQLVSVAAFLALLGYVRTRSMWVLTLMAVLPAAGFFVKQSLAIWAVFYSLHLALFDRPRSLLRLAVFATASCGLVGCVVAACYAVWGSPFLYWTFTVLGSHGVSPLRSVQHLLDIWPYLAIGLFSGFVLLRRDRRRPLLGPWLIWLLLILSQTYTSGIAWMLNHIGPGSLIATIWFLAALTTIWPLGRRFAPPAPGPAVWGHQGIRVAMVCLLFSGLGFIRIPMRAFSEDAYRYVADIEREFQGQPPDRVLLDAGSWVYAQHDIVMKDRAPCIGERGYSETGDFSGILRRIREKRYSKILVRNFDQPDFWYDHYLWRKPSGIKQALLDNYHETGKIAHVSEPPTTRDRAEDPYLFGEITVLAPNANGI